MSRTQPPVEHIDLIPTPMDTWRAALDTLIACAPGDTSAIAWHLADAYQSSLIVVDRTVASPGAERLVDRLMLISAGRLLGNRLSRGEAHQISHRLLEPARRHGAARQPAPDEVLAMSRRAEHQPTYPDRQPNLQGPGRDQQQGGAQGQQMPSASKHQESADRG
jgi:hypothetical protein